MFFYYMLMIFFLSVTAYLYFHFSFSTIGNKFEFNDMCPLSYFLGLEENYSTSGLRLSQLKCIVDIFKKNSMTNYKAYHMPVCDKHLSSNNGELENMVIIYATSLNSSRLLASTIPHFHQTWHHPSCSSCCLIHESTLVLTSYRRKKDTLLSQYS